MLYIISPMGIASMGTYKHDLVDIKRQAAGDWLAALSALAPTLESACERVGRHVPCPIHGGKDGFRLLPDAGVSGMGVCNSCHEKPIDGVGMLMWANGWTMPESLAAIAEYLGTGSTGNTATRAHARTHARTVGQAAIERRKLAMGKQWIGARREPHRQALAYFETRGLACPPLSESLRYHGGLPYYAGGKAITDDGGRWLTWPCIVGMMRSGIGCAGLMKIYLTMGGKQATHEIQRAAGNDAEISCKPFFSVSGLVGSGVRLSPATDTLAICEGLETALAVQQMTNLPVVACGTAALMQGVDIPARVNKVLIYSDNDENGTGIKAANSLKNKILTERQGASVDVLLPEVDDLSRKTSVDWLDVLCTRGCAE